MAAYWEIVVTRITICFLSISTISTYKFVNIVFSTLGFMEWEFLSQIVAYLYQRLIYTQQKKLRKMCSSANYEKSSKALEIKTSEC